MRSRNSLLVLIFLAFAACSPAAPSLAPLQLAQPVAPTAPPPTATPLPTATATPTPLPTETPTPTFAIPPFLTSTPGAVETLAAQQTMAAATEASKLQELSGVSLSQCPNPADPPRQNWVDIPVMPQATAGQVVQTLIGSYYCFRAPVTLQAMETYYKANLTAPNWEMQNDTNGSMVFIGLGQAGAQILFLVSGPGNKNDLIVAINVTNPLVMPTRKP